MWTFTSWFQNSLKNFLLFAWIQSNWGPNTSNCTILRWVLISNLVNIREHGYRDSRLHIVEFQCFFTPFLKCVVSHQTHPVLTVKTSRAGESLENGCHSLRPTFNLNKNFTLYVTPGLLNKARMGLRQEYTDIQPRTDRHKNASIHHWSWEKPEKKI